MTEAPQQPARGAGRSATLVAACRMLASEQPESERLFDDPFAHLVVDDDAVAAARADEPLRIGVQLRTRYIDDAVKGFAAAHPGAQVLLLGAGLNARAYRLDVDADFFEVDFPATLERKAEVLAGAEPKSERVVVPVDLAERSFIEPLTEAGFDPARPTIVVWEGVINYLDAPTAEAVVEQISQVVGSGGQLIADYAEMSWFKGSQFERSASKIRDRLRSGGEKLRAGLPDAHGTLDRAGFDVVDDESTEMLAPRYGWPKREQFYPARILTAVKR